MGSNWVPLDAFHSRAAERLPEALRLLDEAGCNAVRCWGGNVYEDTPFFDFCDEHGIKYYEHTTFDEDVINQSDILYMTRVQRERFTDLE